MEYRSVTDMLAVLSPAKNLDLSPGPFRVAATVPVLMQETVALMQVSRRLSQTKIRTLMKLSPDLAKLNYDRFRSFQLPFSVENATPAAFAFNGDVYRGLSARTLDLADLDWAQDHVRILSGLYGVLRPLDLMQAYRLEMGTKLATRRGTNLYQFWGDRVRTATETLLAGHDDPTLVNLASAEYFKVLQEKHMLRSPVTCVFEDWKTRPDEGKVISFMAKVARGMMARYIATQRVDRAEGLKDFKESRYRFDQQRSTEHRWVFVRKFVPVGELLRDGERGI